MGCSSPRSRHRRSVPPGSFLDKTGQPFTTQIIHDADRPLKEGCPVLSGENVTRRRQGTPSFAPGSRDSRFVRNCASEAVISALIYANTFGKV